MILPDYWIQRPAVHLDNRVRSDFEQLLAQVKSAGKNTLIPYKLTAPKWQFLCYIAEHHPIVLHGTSISNLDVFEPRPSVDLYEFGNQTAVYATGDGILATFFAIIDRERYSMSVNNACFRVADPEGDISEPHYLFSISQAVLPQQPWRTGFVYLLPLDTFVAQPPEPLGTHEIRVPQFASLVSVTPLARLEISPVDFPFLDQIRGHDDTRLDEYVQAMQTGGAWPG